MRYALAMAALAALSCAASAKELKDAPRGLDPAKAYVLVELGMLDAGPVRSTIVLARYDAESRDVLGHGRSQVVLERRAQAEVHETVSKGFVKEDERRLHLLELEPGLYVIEGANGTSFSLGSRTFRAEAGTVTDLGVMAVATDWPEGEGPQKLGAGDIGKLLLFGAFAGPRQEPRPTFVTVRARVSSDLQPTGPLAAQARVVEWQAGDATFGNHLGGLVNRFGGRAERGARASATAQSHDQAGMSAAGGADPALAEPRPAF